MIRIGMPRPRQAQGELLHADGVNQRLGVLGQGPRYLDVSDRPG